MDLFEDDQPVRNKKEEKLEDLFEGDSSEASSHNEDADLFEANIDFENVDPDQFKLSEDEEETEIKMTKEEKKKEVKKDKKKGPQDTQTELDEKLDQIKERAERLKNKGKDPAKIEKKKENLKAFVIFQTLIMRNPQHYDNFMKLYILCLYARWHFYTKLCNSKHILGLALSRLDLVDLELLDKLKVSYKHNPEHNFKERLLSLVGVILRNFPYEKFNDHHIMFNLSENGTYSYENILMIFYALCKYVGIHVRIVNVIDLACLHVNKKHLYVAPGMRLPGVKSQVRKRKVEQAQSTDQNAPIIEEYRPKLKQGKLNKKSFSSMITSFTTSFVDANEEKPKEQDFMGFIEDELDSENSGSQATKSTAYLTKEEKEFDSKMSSFGFRGVKKASVAPSESSQMLIEGGDSSQKIQMPSSNSSHKGKANKTNISKFAFGKKNTNAAAVDIDLSEFHFWLEVFDYTQKKWIQVEPLKRKVYDDQEDIKKRLHGTAPFFILTFQKYQFTNEALKFNVEKYRSYYVRDVSINYIERWHKLLVSRRELNINQWWGQVTGYFKFWPGLSNEEWKNINKWEDEYAVELEKKDMPQNPREFRYSRFYILPSMLKKYQAFYPEAKPLPIKFHEEPIYEKTAVCELHSRARWRRNMRQVKEGEQPAKKVLSLVGNNEQLIDLYGIWQTEPFENKLREDGSLPKNEYGNYEIFNGELPEGVVYINFNGLPRLCRKLGIDFVEAISGFEIGKAGRPHAVISGIIAFAKDEEVIRDAYEKYKDYIAEKEREKVKKTVIGLWKGIFRKILVKKYILETYQKEADNELAH